MVIFLLILFIYLFYSGFNKLFKCSFVLLESGYYFVVILEIVLLGYLVGFGIVIRLLDCK